MALLIQEALAFNSVPIWWHKLMLFKLIILHLSWSHSRIATLGKQLFGMAAMPFLCRGAWFSPKLSYHRPFNCRFPIFLFIKNQIFSCFFTCLYNPFTKWSIIKRLKIIIIWSLPYIMSSSMMHQKKKNRKRKLAITDFLNQLSHLGTI